MLAYAANRPAAGKRQSSPNALLVVISIHVALLAAVMSAKMDLPARIRHDPTIISLIPEPTPPPNTTPVKPKTPQPPQPTFDNPSPQVQLPTATTVDVTPSIDFGKLVGPGTGESIPTIEPTQPPPLAVHHEARLLTPPSELKPPYPASKLASEEEAVLMLRLTIDERGRVTAVDPVGPADRAFLESARRYLIAHWRYQPASEGDRAIASSVVIKLRFELDG